MEILLANNAESTLAAAIGAADVSLTIATGDSSKFPELSGTKRFRVTLERKNTGEREVVLVSTHAAGSTTLAGLTRAQEGTSALTFSVGDYVTIQPTKALLDEMRQFTRQNPTAVASANDVTLDPTYGYVQISGVTNIQRIASASWNGGQRVTLKFNGAVTVEHNVAAGGGFVEIFLSGGINLARTAGQTLTLVFDETDSKFYQV